MDKLSKLFEQYKMNPGDAATKSKAWFNQQVVLLNATKINPSLLKMNRDEMSKVGRIMPGSMYVFEYDPKYAEEILAQKEHAYYDAHPLVIPFRQVPGAFYGLNLHYLHPQLRVKLLDGLMKFASNKTLDENTKLKFTWQMAHAAAKNKYISSCVKMYLTHQVRSQFMKIEPEHWVGALMLPIDSFVGGSKQGVWKESTRI